MATAELHALEQHLVPLKNSSADYDRLLESIGESRFVLLGEATHGTHEFYHARSEITQRLIEEKGFHAVVVEADWPDAYRVNRWVRGSGEDEDGVEALGDFQRFPTWMWRNAPVLEFVGWLRESNDGRPEDQRTGFYGMDLYSLHASIDAVLKYLNRTDPEAARRARERYSCFENFGEDPQAYGYLTARGGVDSCEDAAVAQLVEMRELAADLARRDGWLAEDESFFAEQNARLAVNAERYYRLMYRGRASSWNMRDRHMSETVEALDQQISRRKGRAKLVIWAHNSHLGDARATEMSRRGELNVGQLMRERYGRDAYLVGFTTHSGTVTAADDWDGPARRKHVVPALPDSYENFLHNFKLRDFYFVIRDSRSAAEAVDGILLERAIGVIYRPETERMSHYFEAVLSRQFDAVIHFDRTRAVEPLERGALWTTEDQPPTWPFTV